MIYFYKFKIYNQTGASLIEHVFNGGTATYFC